ncbi:hypothetical protein Mal4_03170 [Maioricimonas rarisocia]|uniref:Uncharacterized protein n=1 Tax=Maioricimonas rarisocia TaxID=2528026 RepID=A0A517Z0N1_9PLAN|nr:hypothetical protein Mal4_03170 [Maioricimonas rarisocia]
MPVLLCARGVRPDRHSKRVGGDDRVEEAKRIEGGRTGRRRGGSVLSVAAVTHEPAGSGRLSRPAMLAPGRDPAAGRPVRFDVLSFRGRRTARATIGPFAAGSGCAAGEPRHQRLDHQRNHEHERGERPEQAMSGVSAHWRVRRNSCFAPIIVAEGEQGQTRIGSTGVAVRCYTPGSAGMCSAGTGSAGRGSGAGERDGARSTPTA